MNPHKNKHNLTASFKYALNGIWFMVKTQRNAVIHFAAAIGVTLLAVVLKLSTAEWILLVMAIALVIAAELFNTAIEYLIDLLSPEFHEKAGKAKDIGAGAVLICAVAAAIIGLVIFIPRLF